MLKFHTFAVNTKYSLFKSTCAESAGGPMHKPAPDAGQSGGAPVPLPAAPLHASTTSVYAPPAGSNNNNRVGVAVGVNERATASVPQQHGTPTITGNPSGAGANVRRSPSAASQNAPQSRARNGKRASNDVSIVFSVF